ncbi:MAG: hypothetical protein FJ134_14290 [Deltaproteobacteria bacterium]|nr:hypothetical protein [Deltaproteobacteria bacterium]
MAELIEKIHGGYRVDGLDLMAGNCGCGGLTGPGGSGTGECCFTFSRVKRDGQTVSFYGKYTTPNTTNNYEWGYRVIKDGAVVDVKMLDTRGPKEFKFGGHMPPPLAAWQARGWKVEFQYERPVEGTGEPLPEWCDSPESACVRPDITREEGKGRSPAH